jgi:hypothetical protein
MSSSGDVSLHLKALEHRFEFFQHGRVFSGLFDENRLAESGIMAAPCAD